MLARIDAHGLDLRRAEALGLDVADADHGIGVGAGLGVVLAADEVLHLDLALGEVGLEALVRLGVLGEGVTVQHSGVLHVLRLGQRPHVVAAFEQEARGDDRVGAVGIDGLTVDADVDDALVAIAGGVEDVLDVLGDAEGQERLVAGLDRAAVLGPLPLLLEHLLELDTGDLARVQGVAERHHGVRVGVGDHAVTVGVRGVLEPQLGADAAGVHEADDLTVAGQTGVLEVPLHRVGEHVAGGGVAVAVVALGGGVGHGLALVRGPDAVHVGGAAGGPRGGDVRGQRADLDGTGDLGIRDRLIGDLGDVRGDLGGDAAALVREGGRHEGGIGGGGPLPLVVELEGDHAEVAAVVAGLDDRAILTVGAGGLVVVGAVGVTVVDDVDTLGGLAHDLVEDRVGVVGRLTGLGVHARTLVVRGDDHVVLLAGGLQLGVGLVDGVDRIAELEALDRDRGDLADGLGGDRTDHGNAHVTGVDDGVGLVDPLTGVLVAHVRGEVREVGARLDALQEVVDALVVLVVADRGGGDAQRVQDVDRGLVVLHGRGEGGAAHAVTCGDQGGVGVLSADRLDGAGQTARIADGSVEVVEAHQGDLVTGLRGGHRAEGHERAGESDGRCSEADGRAARQPAGGNLEHECLLGTQ